MPAEARAAGCIDIARQFVAHAANGQIDVAFGGGRRGFLPVTMADPEYPQQHGKRGDGRDLIAQWKRIPDARFVWNAAQFAALDPALPGRYSACSNPSTCTTCTIAPRMAPANRPWPR